MPQFVVVVTQLDGSWVGDSTTSVFGPFSEQDAHARADALCAEFGLGEHDGTCATDEDNSVVLRLFVLQP